MDDIGWAGVGLAAVTAVGTAYNTLMQFLAKRDAMRNDVKVALLEDDNKRCHDSWKRIDGELSATKAELDKCREQHAESEKRHQDSEADRAEMKKRMDQLEKLAELLQKRLDRGKASADKP
jgi:hypothetical protein